MFENTVRSTVAVLAFGACVAGTAAYGAWSAGKLIVDDDGDLMRYEMDLHGGAKLYAILSADGTGDVQAVHLVPNTELGGTHWLYYKQAACRWDGRAGAWADIVIGDRMTVSIPSTSWEDDEGDADGRNALDEQLLAVGSSAVLLALFDTDPEERSSFLPTQQRLDDETGWCAPVADDGDNSAVGNVVLIAEVDDGSRAVDITRAAAMLHKKVSLNAMAGMMVIAEMVDASGMAIGEAVFEQTPSGVLMQVSVTGLAPGAHGIHLHRVGACSPDFTAASGHINPHGAMHGLRHPLGPDNGDLPLLHVGFDGTAQAEFFTTRVSLSMDAMGDPPGLLDEDGSAVVIHANPDDHFTQPIGGAGCRVACGVIEGMEPVTPDM